MSELYKTIQLKVQQYSNSLLMLTKDKSRLNIVQDELKDMRKIADGDDVNISEKIKELNKEHAALKEEISRLKREVKQLAVETEGMILKSIGLVRSETPLYEKGLSLIYGFDVEIVLKQAGEVLVKATKPTVIVVTDDKAQHGRILKTLSYGLVNKTTGEILKCSEVEICGRIKNATVGTEIPYSERVMKRMKI